MRKAIEGKKETLGFTIIPRKGRCIPSKTITDVDFADDIALISNLITQAQQLLLAVEAESKKVGLSINVKKTKYISFNITNEIELKIADGTKIKRAVTEVGRYHIARHQSQKGPSMVCPA